jgi:hypothetical protein
MPEHQSSMRRSSTCIWLVAQDINKLLKPVHNAHKSKVAWF